MTTKNIVIHIGFHKTGTSTIQAGLHNNSKRLRKAGWLYPQTGRIPNAFPAHYNIAFELHDSPHFNKDHGALMDLVGEIAAAPQKNILLSSENFGLAHADGIARLHTVLSELGLLKIVVYVRPQTEWLPSMWSQYVKMAKMATDFKGSLERLQQEADFYARLTPWRKVFGEDSITVRVLEPGQLNGHLVEDFLETCDIRQPRSFRIPEDQNRSAGAKTIAVIRWFNQRLGEADFPLNQHLSHHVARLVFAFAENAGWNKERPNLVNEGLFHEIKALYAESNHNLAREYLGRDWLFHNNYQDRPLSVFHISDLDPQEMLELSVYIAEGLLEKPYGLPDIGPQLQRLNQQNQKLRQRIERLQNK